MYRWAFIFLIAALVAAVLGFGGMADAFADIAVVIFVIALVATLLFFVLGWRAAKAVVE
jgi:uncharacterized membrane protein YtjA (UPF0391 family)